MANASARVLSLPPGGSGGRQKLVELYSDWPSAALGGVTTGFRRAAIHAQMLLCTVEQWGELIIWELGQLHSWGEQVFAKR